MMHNKKTNERVQNMESTQDDQISRRKLLASMGVAGAAVASGAFIPGMAGQVSANPNRDADENVYRYEATLPERTVGDKLREFVSVKDFGAKGDGLTDDTKAIQTAFDYASTLYGGDTSKKTGYIGWFEPQVLFPTGTYICGTVSIPENVKITGNGQVVIQSNVGTDTAPAGYFVNNKIRNLHVSRISFLYYDTCFRIPTGNQDFSSITFEECNIANTNLFVDTIGYWEARSTTFKMSRCRVTYGVTTIGKIYTDKSYFEGNWFMHTSDAFLFYMDSFGTFRDNVWVPLNAGTQKAYINFSTSDSVRGLVFTGERFGGESGSCPIVVVGDVNAGGSNDPYRNQGIEFIDCFLASNSTYNPDGTAGVRACVILKPTISPLNSINFVSFKNSAFLPDLSGGVVQTYNVNDITKLVYDDFIIDFDY